jgi:hypothetical protein
MTTRQDRPGWRATPPRSPNCALVNLVQRRRPPSSRASTRSCGFPIVVSAILPLIVVPESSGWPGIVVGVVTWLVFLVDYVVHGHHLVRYGRTGYGRFDLMVVLVTAPWSLLPGAQPGRFVVLLRLARLVRLVVASRGSRRLFSRLGRVAAFAVGVAFFGSVVAYDAEQDQPGVRDLRRRALVGCRHADDRGLRGRGAQDVHRKVGGGDDHAHGHRRPRSAPVLWPASSASVPVTRRSSRATKVRASRVSRPQKRTPRPTCTRRWPC